VTAPSRAFDPPPPAPHRGPRAACASPPWWRRPPLWPPPLAPSRGSSPSLLPRSSAQRGSCYCGDRFTFVRVQAQPASCSLSYAANCPVHLGCRHHVCPHCQFLLSGPARICSASHHFSTQGTPFLTSAGVTGLGL
jgi:hypothetical protein